MTNLKNTLVICMPRLSNWSRFFEIRGQKRIDFLNKLDKEIPSIFLEIGAKEVK